MGAGLEAHLVQSGAAELVHELQRMEIKMRARMLVCTGGHCLDLDTASQQFILHWSPSRCPDFTVLVLRLYSVSCLSHSY